MAVTWSRRLTSALRRPTVTSVARYLNARAAGDIETEDVFFWQLQLASGVYKATNRRRLDDTFPMILRALPPGGGRLRVLDVACSSGISTVELHEALARGGREVETVGTDIAIRVRRVRLDRRRALICDLDGHLLAAEIDDVMINRRPIRAVRIHHPWRVRQARRLIAAHQAPAGRRFEPPPAAEVTDVELVSSAVARTPGVRVVEEDLLRPQVDGEFDLIRAANILNQGYFSEAQLQDLLRTTLPRVARGGLLFVVRSEGTVHNGTLWRRDDGLMTELERVGKGSEIAALVQAWRA